MATSTPQGSPPNAAVVIRERIKQKRLFEAQFLFGLLDEDDVSPQEKLVLERELNGLLAVVRDLQIQANKYLADGEYNLARKMHREMERIAVDVPGLENGKRRAETQEEAPLAQAVQAPQATPAVQDPVLPDLVEGPSQPSPPAPETEVAEILWPVDDVPDIPPQTSDAEPSPERLETAPEEAPASMVAAESKKRSGSPKKKLLLAAAVLILALLGLLFMKATRHEASGRQAEVAIKPLSVRQNDDASGQTPTAAPGAESSRITIGELMIEE